MIYMKLVKYLFYILMLLGVTGVWAQKSDIRLGKLLNNGIGLRWKRNIL